jgi:hypothetical protein
MGNTAPVAWGSEEAPLGKQAAAQRLGETCEEAPKSSIGESKRNRDRDEATLLPRRADGDKRQPHLDLCRFICVLVVVLDHGAPEYAKWNAFFGQNWTLQLIYVICGISLGLSNKGFGGYLGRLGAYVVVGVLCNWFAWVVTGQDWQSNVWGVVFQFWFVVGLMLYSVMLIPLKQYLAWAASRDQLAAAEESYGAATLLDRADAAAADSTVRGLSLVALGLVIIWMAVSVALSQLLDGQYSTSLEEAFGAMGNAATYWESASGSAASSLIKDICAALELSLSNIWLAVAVPALLPQRQSLAGWLILVNMHARRLLSWYSGLGEKALNGFDLMLLGLTCFYLGLAKRRQIGVVVARYWWAILFCIGLLWKGGTYGRYDQLQATPMWLTWRMRLLDFFFAMAFLSAGERFVDPKIFTEDKLGFIGNLGLFLFLVHKAVHIVVPAPFNWFLLISFGPLFWFAS